MEESKIKYRNASLEIRESGEPDQKREISLAFSSENPVMMYDFERNDYVYEVLGHKQDEINLDILGSGRAPLLLDHSRDANSQVGVVQNVAVKESVGRASVKFSRSPKGREIEQDVVDGVRQNVSVGYMVNKSIETGEVLDGYKIVRAIDWQPREISIVTLGADSTVGVGRNDQQLNNNKGKKMAEKTENKQDVNVEEIRAQATKAETDRVRDILSLGSKFDMMNDAQDFIGRSKTVEDFKSFALDNLAKQRSEKQESARTVQDTVPAIQQKSAEIGMSKKELDSYSMVKIIRAHAFPENKKFREEAGLEIEASEAAVPLQPHGQRGTFVVPYDAVMYNRQPKRRDLIVGNASDSPVDTQYGNFTVPTYTQSMIEILRSQLVVQRAGATVLTGLSGDLSFPRHDTASVGYWVAESGAVTESTQTISQLQLTPKTVGALTEYSRKLILQSSIDVESFVRQDQAAVLARAIDSKAISGDGTSNTPTGITNTTSVGARTINSSGSPLPYSPYEDLVLLWSDIATQNADLGSLAYIESPATSAIFRTAKKDAGSGIFVEEGQQIDGYNVYVSTQVPANTVIFGNWRELLLGFFGGLDVLIDPYSSSNSGTVRIVSFQSVDVGVRHAASFSVGTLA